MFRLIIRSSVPLSHRMANQELLQNQPRIELVQSESSALSDPSTIASSKKTEVKSTNLDEDVTKDLLDTKKLVQGAIAKSLPPPSKKSHSNEAISGASSRTISDASSRTISGASCQTFNIPVHHKSKHGTWKKNQRKVNPVSNSTKPPRVNHFIAFQIHDSKIRDGVEKIQQRMMESKIIRMGEGNKKEHLAGNIFQSTLCSVAKLHFTLHVIALNDHEEKEKAKSALEKVWKQFEPLLIQSQLIAHVHGMGTFDDAVLFAKLEGEDEIKRLSELAECIRNEFNISGIYGESRPFNPHMTIAKLSQSRELRKKGIRTFPVELWKDFENYEFGCQIVNGIQLLTMQETDEAGYYKALAQFNLK